MMDIKGDLVKELREKTNAGVMDCKRALVEAKGNFEQAVSILKTRGLAAAQKKAERQVSQGLIFSYIHMGGKIGVLLEINCETDFVARNAGFQELAKDIALQIAGAHPTALYVSRQQVEAEEVAKAQSQNGSNLEKYYEQTCLLDQPFIKNPSLTIQQLMQAKIAELGENIVVRRFSRFQLGEPLADA